MDDDNKEIGAIGSTQIDTIKIDDLFKDSLTVDVSSAMSGYMYSTPSSSYGNITINTSAGMNGTSGSYYTSNGAGSNVWTTNTTNPWSMSSTSPSPGLKVNGDAEFEGKVMINGRNISEFMETISKRLAILVPDPAKLEHFESLKKAYQHYKTLEALCEIPEKKDD